MNYDMFIGSKCEVLYRFPKLLDIKRWKECDYHTTRVEGKVVSGTFGIIVIEDEKGLAYRINDELIVYFREIEKGVFRNEQ